MDKITETYIELNEAAPKRKMSNKQTMKVLDALESNKSGVIRGLRDLLKDLKVTDGKVNFNVTKTIKLIKKTIDALKTLEKDSTKEFDRLVGGSLENATLEVGGPALSTKGSSPKSRR